MYSLAMLISVLVWVAFASLFIYAVICFVNSPAYEAIRERMIRRQARYKRSSEK